MGVGPYAGRMLSLFGAHVQAAFGHTAYQVGSSLTEKRGWRDVDVRLILPDDEYDAMFGVPESPRHEMQLDARRLTHQMAWSAFGEKMTGLPIDFQFQRQTEANHSFTGVRSALRVLESRLPVVRDHAD